MICTMLMCSKYHVNMIFCKPAVRCTLWTIYVVDLYIITLFIETAFQLIYLNYAINISGDSLTALDLFSLIL